MSRPAREAESNYAGMSKLERELAQLAGAPIVGAVRYFEVPRKADAYVKTNTPDGLGFTRIPLIVGTGSDVPVTIEVNTGTGYSTPEKVRVKTTIKRGKNGEPQIKMGVRNPNISRVSQAASDLGFFLTHGLRKRRKIAVMAPELVSKLENPVSLTPKIKIIKDT